MANRPSRGLRINACRLLMIAQGILLGGVVMADDWVLTPLQGIPSKSPYCCDSQGMIFVPGGPAIGTSGSNLVFIGEQLVGWNGAGEVIAAHTGGPYEFCTAIDANANGDIVAMVSICPQTDGSCISRPRLIRMDGSVIEIDQFESPWGRVHAINDAGTSVGVARIDETPWLQQAWIHDMAGGVRMLETPEDCWAASVTDIAEDGTVIGYTDTIGESGSRPLVWRNETHEYLPTVEQFGRAERVDGSGRIYGTCLVNNRTVPVRWTGDDIKVFELPPNAFSCEIHDVNASGQAVGVYRNQSNTEFGVFVIQADNTLEIPGPMPANLANVFNVRIDESGMVIGTVLDGLIYTHDGFLREPGGPIVMLHTISGGILEQGLNEVVAVDSGRLLVSSGFSAQESWIMSRVGNPADLNQDGRVDAADLGLLLSYWGHCPDAPGCPGDLDQDGLVDAADIGLLLAAWSPSG
ncbi:MAG: hypothetical protein MK085_04470 [Phycisphaerales bacterium]|nr:hypothetical protein [Phycisphaerales bacterium]